GSPDLAARAGAAGPRPSRRASGPVPGGQQGQRHRSTPSQLASSAAPASPDFSGWNWVAHSGPFSPAATNGSPWVAQVTSGGVMCGDGGSGGARAAEGGADEEPSPAKPPRRSQT